MVLSTTLFDVLTNDDFFGVELKSRTLEILLWFSLCASGDLWNGRHVIRRLDGVRALAVSAFSVVACTASGFGNSENSQFMPSSKEEGSFTFFSNAVARRGDAIRLGSQSLDGERRYPFRLRRTYLARPVDSSGEQFERSTGISEFLPL